jgi:hypothetical protein
MVTAEPPILPAPAVAGTIEIGLSNFLNRYRAMLADRKSSSMPVLRMNPPHLFEVPCGRWGQRSAYARAFPLVLPRRFHGPWKRGWPKNRKRR